MSNRDGLSLMDTGMNPLKTGLLERHLRPGTCLDLGCGHGCYGLVMQQRAGTVLQVDVVDRRAPDACGLPFRAGDVRTLALEQTFDHVVAFDLMEHLEDDDAFLRRVRSWCRGRLFLSVPNEDDAALRRLHLTFEHHVDKTHCREYTRSALEAKLAAHGFRVREIVPAHTAGVLRTAEILAGPGPLSRTAARALSLQTRALARLGILHNPCIADWLCVAEAT